MAPLPWRFILPHLVLHAEHHAGEVNGEVAVPGPALLLGDGDAALLDARVVEGAVEAPVVLHGGGDGGLDLGLVGHVAGDKGGLAAFGGDCRGGGRAPLDVDIGEDHGGALAREAPRRGQPDPRRGPVTSAALPLKL